MWSRITIIVFVSLTFATEVLAQEPAPEVRNHFFAALKAQDEGKLDAAANEYREVLKLDPRLAEAYRNLGLVLHEQLKIEASIGCLQKALELKPGIAGANLYLGLDYLKLNRLRLAVTHLRIAVEQEPGNKQAAASLAKAFWDSGQRQQALEILEKAAIAFPTDPDMLFLLGEGYRKEGNEQFDAIRAADPNSLLIDWLLAESLAHQQRWQQAYRLYNRMLRTAPRSPGVHLALGSILLAQGKMSEAEEEYKAVAAVGASPAYAQAALAEIGLLHGDIDGFVARLESAIRSDAAHVPDAFFSQPVTVAPESVRERYEAVARNLQQNRKGSPAALHLALALVSIRIGDAPTSDKELKLYAAATQAAGRARLTGLDEAEFSFACRDYSSATKQLQQVLAKDTGNLRGRYLLGKVYQTLAVQTLEHLVVVATDSYRAHQLLAEGYQARGENEKALSEYRLAEQLQPRLPGLHYEIGDLLFSLKRVDAAREEFARELEVNPDHAEANAALGTLLLADYQADRAIPYLQKAVRLHPDLIAAHRELGHAYMEQQDYPKAEMELKQTLSADADGSAHYMLGTVYRELGRTEESRRFLETAARLKAAVGAPEPAGKGQE